MSVLYNDESINIQEYYQENNDWISPVNKPSGLWFIPMQQSVGENEYGKSCHLSIFTLLNHLIVILKCNFFQSFIFTPYQRHW